MFTSYASPEISAAIVINTTVHLDLMLIIIIIIAIIIITITIAERSRVLCKGSGLLGMSHQYQPPPEEIPARTVLWEILSPGAARAQSHRREAEVAEAAAPPTAPRHTAALGGLGQLAACDAAPALSRLCCGCCGRGLGRLSPEEAAARESPAHAATRSHPGGEWRRLMAAAIRPHRSPAHQDSAMWRAAAGMRMVVSGQGAEPGGRGATRRRRCSRSARGIEAVRRAGRAARNSAQSQAGAP